MRAMEELQLYSIVLIGWKAVHGMDVTDWLYAQTVRYYLLAFVNICFFPFLVSIQDLIIGIYNDF